MEHADGDLNFAFFLTMNEVIELVEIHCEQVRNTDDLRNMGVHLKMASRALRSALEIYGSHVLKKNEDKNE